MPDDTPQPTLLNSCNLNWIGLRGIDPVGRVFLKDNRFVRAIYPKAAENVDKLLRSPVLDQLVHEGLMPPTRKGIQQVRGFAFTTETETSPFQVPAINWLPSTLRDAALCWIRINELLLENGHGLIDGHPGNMALFAGQPKWIDLGSIQPGETPGWSIREFITKILLPLMVMAERPVLQQIARQAIVNGLSSAEFTALTGRSFNTGETEPRRVIAALHNTVEGLSLTPDQTFWSGYTSLETLEDARVGTLPDKDPRWAHFNRFIDRIQPVKAMDLGSSSGTFTVSIARHGVPCLAVDTDTIALERLAGFARKQALPVTTQLADVLTVPRQPDVDLVCAMALTHHLAVTQFTPFPVIAKLLANLTSHALVTEFMPNGLGGLNPHPGTLPDGYNLENFSRALQRYFADVEIIDYERPGAPRIMIQCSGRLP